MKKSQNSTAQASLTIFMLIGCAWFLQALWSPTHLYAAQNEAAEQADVEDELEDADQPARIAHLVRVPLPINSASAASVRQTLERLVENAPAMVRPEDRPVIVLEFDTSNGNTGQGSKLESCLELARYLVGPDLSRVKTIAYIPAAKMFREDNLAEQAKPASRLNGHAVLVAIAASEIAMHRDSAIGNATIDEKNKDQIVADMYRNIAKVRLTLPVPMVMSMVDPRMQLFEVTTKDGLVFSDAAELERLETQGEVSNAKTLSSAGELAEFTSQQMVDFRLVRKRVESKSELARILDVPPSALESDPTLGKEWDAVQLTFPDYVDSETVDWVVRALGARSPNLIIFRINSSGGDPESCYRLATFVSEYDSGKVRTVAFVSGVARGPAALFALSCDHLIMTPSAEVGGTPDPEVDEEWLIDTQSNLVDLAKSKERDWSIYRAVLDPSFRLSRYRERNSGQIRLLSNEEFESLADPESWVLLGPIDIHEGMDAAQAEQLFVARAIADDMSGVQAFYQLDNEPSELAPTMTDRWLERLARFLSSPMVAPWLLFGAVFFLSTEMSAPGVGVPGFIGTLCLVAFFWSQHLDGNAHWLEILLFFIGAIFIAMELFLLPGFGIFGIGGLLMMVVSIVLASQSFIIPTTAEQLNRLPISLSMVLAGAMGFFVAIAVLRKVLPNTPYLKRMMLEPPVPHESTGLESDKDPGAVVDWSYLQGRTGETITRLFPAGKAKIDGKIYDVISDGRMIDKGEEIEVVQAVGNRVVVMPK